MDPKIEHSVRRIMDVEFSKRQVSFTAKIAWVFVAVAFGVFLTLFLVETPWIFVTSEILVAVAGLIAVAKLNRGQNQIRAAITKEKASKAEIVREGHCQAIVDGAAAGQFIIPDVLWRRMESIMGSTFVTLARMRITSSQNAISQ